MLPTAASIPPRASWLVTVTLKSGEQQAFRWPSRARATRCAAGFSTSTVVITKCFGWATFDGWVEAPVVP